MPSKHPKERPVDFNYQKETYDLVEELSRSGKITLHLVELLLLVIVTLVIWYIWFTPKTTKVTTDKTAPAPTTTEHSNQDRLISDYILKNELVPARVAIELFNAGKTAAAPSTQPITVTLVDNRPDTPVNGSEQTNVRVEAPPATLPAAIPTTHPQTVSEPSPATDMFATTKTDGLYLSPSLPITTPTTRPSLPPLLRSQPSAPTTMHDAELYAFLNLTPTGGKVYSEVSENEVRRENGNVVVRGERLNGKVYRNVYSSSEPLKTVSISGTLQQYPAGPQNEGIASNLPANIVFRENEMLWFAIGDKVYKASAWSMVTDPVVYNIRPQPRVIVRQPLR